MYIKNITIKGFRNFGENVVEFHEGINVLIGHNNAGKSNLLRAMQLVLEPHCRCRRLQTSDFCKNTKLEVLKSHSPKVEISVVLANSKEDEQVDDLRMVANWLIKMDADYGAQLTYIFALQEGKEEEYIDAVKNLEAVNDVWTIIERKFIRYYTYSLLAGDLIHPSKPESENIDKFDFQFLGALRNVEDDLFSSRSQLLHDVLSFFIDYEIKSDADLVEQDKKDQIETKENETAQKADELIEILKQRLSKGKDTMLEYAKNTGASFNGAEPDFSGVFSEYDLFNALRLIVKYAAGFDIPIQNNGLGYNNLIFISLLLAKMQADSDGKYLGSSAKQFPILLIEEPEAHLHPSMQYKFLKFLKENYKKYHRARQIFVTTHSTQITSAILLDEMICLHSDTPGTTTVCYPGRVFTDDEEGIKSKKFVQRFLDATKSDMLFANKVVMVEGLAEELLLPVLANYMGYSLEDEHVAIVSVGNRYFSHFLKLFDTNESHLAIPTKVVCITDRDPVKKGKAGSKWLQCYPYEFATDAVNFDYKINAEDDIRKYSTYTNIRMFSQDKDKGKTFEYDLALCNSKLGLLLTESIENQAELKKLMSQTKLQDMLDALRKSKANERIKDAINASSWSDEDKMKAVIASRYLNSVGKGENALELSVVLKDNFELKDDDPQKKTFVVPQYIQEALTWLLQ